MSNEWTSVSVGDVQAGDHIRQASGAEFDVARIQRPFLGLDNMVCFIEDTPSRWHAYPARVADEVEVRRSA
jgi:hypothetical protein